MGLKFSQSLKGSFEFRRVFRKGESAVSGYMVIYRRRRTAGQNRVGIVVSAKLGNAVTRNRIRRRIREIYRLNEDRFTTGLDIVVVARSRAVDASYRTLNGDFLRLADRLGMIK